MFTLAARRAVSRMFDRKLTKPEFFRYYALVGKIASGSQDSARKSQLVLEDRFSVKGGKINKAVWEKYGCNKHIGPHWTLSHALSCLLFQTYARYGQDGMLEAWPYFARQQGKDFKLWEKCWEDHPHYRVDGHPFFKAQPKPTPVPELPVDFDYDGKSPLEIVRHAEGKIAFWQAYGAKLPAGQEKDLFFIVLDALTERFKSFKEQNDIREVQPVLKVAKEAAKAPIEVKFKHPTDRGANLNTAMVRDGQPVAQIRAGGSARDFWKGVFFTMEFKDELK